jgi:16S rRNA G1207 methylase RsmC
MDSLLSDKNLSIVRYPQSDNKSLRAWNTADEYILNYINEHKVDSENIAIYNDRFGFLSSHFIKYSPSIIIDSKSQEKSITANLKSNNLDLKKLKYVTPLGEIQKEIELAVIKIPKSMELFRLYLNQLSTILADDAIIICGFMTKYFTKQMLEIANEYFEEVEQSLAWKKSRLLILKKSKSNKEKSIINEIEVSDGKIMQQYFGVFSSNNIDYATQFLIENINLRETDKQVLDLASGNGILAFEIDKRKDDCEIDLVDDSFLAVESSKLNLKGENFNFHFSDNLEEFEENYFDFVISNPPSHFEHETNIEISIKLFNEVKRVLKKDGHFQLVANQHLNYKTHLIKIFNNVEITSENKKFVIYDCVK